MWVGMLVGLGHRSRARWQSAPEGAAFPAVTADPTSNYPLRTSPREEAPWSGRFLLMDPPQWLKPINETTTSWMCRLSRRIAKVGLNIMLQGKEPAAPGSRIQRKMRAGLVTPAQSKTV